MSFFAAREASFPGWEYGTIIENPGGFFNRRGQRRGLREGTKGKMSAEGDILGQKCKHPVVDMHGTRYYHEVRKVGNV